MGLRLNSLSVFSMNSKEMLSKALEKSIWSMRPGRLCFGVLKEIKGVSSHISNKPIWEVGFLPGEIILSKIGLSLEVETPEAIL